MTSLLLALSLAGLVLQLMYVYWYHYILSFRRRPVHWESSVARSYQEPGVAGGSIPSRGDHYGVPVCKAHFVA